MKQVLLCVELDSAGDLEVNKFYFDYEPALQAYNGKPGYKVKRYYSEVSPNFYYQRRFIEVRYTKLIRLLFE
jgi:hypothetical protein